MNFLSKAVIILTLTAALLMGGAVAAAETVPAEATALPAEAPRPAEAAAPSELASAVCWPVPGARENAAVNAQPVGGAYYLFLPSSADLTQLSLDFNVPQLTLRGHASVPVTVKSGEAFDLTALFPNGADEEGEYRLSLSDGKADETLRLMRSANQAAVWILSDDPESAGRAYVDSEAGNKTFRATGKMVMTDQHGDFVYQDELREIRGRGNTTWYWSVKKPYQIKLEKKTDLLQSNEKNRARTWLLLAESFDSTLLHNTLSLSLGQALGLTATPEFRPVDFYYDGEYRGYYLLCEKVQVDSARLDIMDYSDYMEELYPDIEDRDAHPVAQATNAYGSTFQYIANLQSDIEARGAYLIELDITYHENEACWFSVTGSAPFVLKSPELASRGDVEYLSGLVRELVDTVNNGGGNPTTGRPLSDYLDYDSMARVLLVHAVAKTWDFGATSTFFYIPEGSGKLYAGPLWDFDVAYNIRNNSENELGVDNYMPTAGWLRDILALPDIQGAMVKIFHEELEPLLSQTLLNETSAPRGTLRSLDDYLCAIDASQKMNYKLWIYGGGNHKIDEHSLFNTYEENAAFLRDYLTGRYRWMKRDMALWSGKTVNALGLSFSYLSAKVPETVKAIPSNLFPHYTVGEIVCRQEPDSDMPWRHIYTADIRLQAKEGIIFGRGLTAVVNDCPAEVIESSDGECIVRFQFSAPFYEEALYGDTDYGLLFQYDYYVDQYPEVLEECGDDRQAVLSNYVDYDLPMGISAIETFDYEKYYECYVRLLENNFTSDTYMSVMYYLENAIAFEMMGLGAPVYPAGA